MRPGRPAGPARPQAGELVGRQPPRAADRRRHDPRVAQRRRAGQRVDHPGDVLVGHRGGQEREPAPAEERPELVERRGEGGRTGGIVGAVEQHVPTPDREELEPARPAGVGVSAPPGRRGNLGDAGRFESVEDRVRDSNIGGLVPASQPDPGSAEPRQIDDQPVTVDRDDGRRVHDRERNAEPSRPPPDDRPRVADSTGDGEVAALDDRRLLARDVGDRRAESVGVVEIDVGDRRHPAVPGMGRVEPPAEADLDEREIDPLLGEPAEDDRGQELELGGVPEAAGQPVGGRDRVPHQPGERARIDGSSADLQPLAIGHEVWLRSLSGTDPGGPQR